MTSSSVEAPVIFQVLAASASVGLKAGGIVKDIWDNQKLDIVEKEGPNDLQTAADRLAQQCIVASLQSQFPRMQIIGEEDLDPDLVTPSNLICADKHSEILTQACPGEYHQILEEDLCVWVDPLDGTKEFTEGFLDHVTVLIGVSWNGKAIGGVIYQPYYDFQRLGQKSCPGRLLWGLVGLGSFEIGKGKLKVNLSQRKDDLIVTTTKSHSNPVVQEAVNACNPTQVLKVGGCGNKILLVIDQHAHAYVFASPGCKRWDTCAPEAVLRAEGGVVTDMLGREINYDPKVSGPKHVNKSGVLATISDGEKFSHSWFLSKIPESVKNALK